MTNHAIAALEFDASTSKRAQQHIFEFALDAPGMVRVTNTDYEDDDPSEHSYLVNVEDGVPVACECPAFEYQPGACKHMVAVAIRTPVLAAAIVRDLEDDHGPEGEAVADGGQLVERPEPDHVETPDTETTPSSITTHGVAGSHAGEAIRESLYDELPGFDEYCAMDWAVCETVAHAASTDSR